MTSVNEATEQLQGLSHVRRRKGSDHRRRRSAGRMESTKHQQHVLKVFVFVLWF